MNKIKHLKKTLNKYSHTTYLALPCQKRRVGTANVMCISGDEDNPAPPVNVTVVGVVVPAGSVIVFPPTVRCKVA